MNGDYSDQNEDRILQAPLFDKIRVYLESASRTRKIVYVIAPVCKGQGTQKNLLRNVGCPSRD